MRGNRLATTDRPSALSRSPHQQRIKAARSVHDSCDRRQQVFKLIRSTLGRRRQYERDGQERRLGFDDGDNNNGEWKRAQQWPLTNLIRREPTVRIGGKRVWPEYWLVVGQSYQIEIGANFMRVPLVQSQVSSSIATQQSGDEGNIEEVDEDLWAVWAELVNDWPNQMKKRPQYIKASATHVHNIIIGADPDTLLTKGVLLTV